MCKAMILRVSMRIMPPTNLLLLTYDSVANCDHHSDLRIPHSLSASALLNGTSVLDGEKLLDFLASIQDELLACCGFYLLNLDNYPSGHSKLEFIRRFRKLLFRSTDIIAFFFFKFLCLFSNFQLSESQHVRIVVYFTTIIRLA